MNLTMLLDMAVDGFGERVLIGRRTDALTAERLNQLSHAGAALIRESGSDALIYLAVNGPAFPIALFSAARAGVPLVPVNYRLGAEQLDRLLANHPKALAIAGEGEGEAVSRAGLRMLSVDEWMAETAQRADAGTEQIEAPDDAPAPAVIIYTSGTTAAPKGVLLRHSNLVSYVFSSVDFMSAEPTDAALMSVPPYHIAAVANVISNLYAGRRTLALQQFEPKQWLELVRTEGVTNALVVPTMLSRILDACSEADGGSDVTVPQLRSLAYGGAPMPRPVIERALALWPNVDFVNAYGLTETSSTVAVLGPEDHRAAQASDDPHVRARLGSVGRVLPAVEIEIRDEEGELLGAGEVGRIWIKGDQVSAEYAGSGPAIDKRGFFDTRDQGYLDEGAYLFIGGRADDTIIRGAENIAPAEIEDVLLNHPDITDAVVVGVPDEEWGQRLEAAVVRKPGSELDESGVREYVRSILRGSKTPDRVVFWPELPRTVTGKLLRRQALEALTQPQGADSPS